MFHPARNFVSSLSERLRADFGNKATGFILALVLEALLVLLLLTLGQSNGEKERVGSILSTFNASSGPEEKPTTPPEKQKEKSKEAPHSPEQAPQPDQPQQHQQQPQPAQPQPARTTPALIPLTHDQMASFDIGKMKSAPSQTSPSRATIGPVDNSSANDTPRVGTAPNGQPLYAAEWYRKPYDSELSGYLSTAQGPGWGLIACKTEPEFKVDQCVSLGEYPENSNIARSVLAAAWQFKVRPPRLGGRSMVGTWVRIRIDYDLKRESDPKEEFEHHRR